MGEWRASLAAARRRLGISREELAKLAGVSPATVRGYEDGRRHPRQESLEAILGALRLERTESNPIREGAGFAPVRFLWGHVKDYYFNVTELQEEVESVPWPEFVVNDVIEVVAANRMACAVWGLDFQAERRRRTSTQMNLLAVASERDFPERIENWAEVLELLCSITKGGVISDGEDISEANPYVLQVVAHFTESDPAFLQNLLEAWQRAEPSPAKVRNNYRIIWRHAAGRMSFVGMMSTANERDGLTFNDWIPANPETWQAIHALLRQMGEDPAAVERELLRPRRQLRPSIAP